MKNSDPSGHDRVPPPKSDHTGALVLTVLALAAFGGWYIMEWDRPDDATPLPVIQRPLMPPTTTEIPSDPPGHSHYTVFQSEDNASAPEKP